MKLHWWALFAILPLILLIGIACGGTSATPTTQAAAPTRITETTTGQATLAPTTAPPTARPGETAVPTAAPRATATKAPAPPLAGKSPVEPRLKVSIPLPQDQYTTFYRVFGTNGLLRPIYDHLIFADRFDLSLQPFLATEWSSNASVTDWTFKLRKGVPFHDAPGFEGDEFTAKDVISAFDLMHAPGNRPHNVPAWEEKLETADNIEVVDDYTVIFHLNSPWITLPISTWEDRGDVMTIYSDKYWKQVGQEAYEAQPIGTGPFKHVELVINEYYLYERFKEVGDDHWWQIPAFDEMQFFFVPEAATRLAQLAAQEVAISDLPVLLVEEAKRQGFEVNKSTLPGSFLFGIFSGQNHRAISDVPRVRADAILDGHRKPHGIDPVYYPDDPLVQLDVRAALNHAIDRQALKDAFFGEKVSFDTVHGVHTFMPQWQEEWVPYAYDPAMSRELLAGAGFPDGSINLTVLASEQFSGWPEGADVAENIVNYWQDVGVNATLSVREVAEVYLRARKFNVTRNEISVQVFVVAPIESTWSAGIRGPGSAVFYDGHLDDVHISQYADSIDEQERFDLEVFFGQYMYDNHGTIPLFARFPESALDPGVIAEYQANYGSMGPVRHHEFTIPVYK